MSKGARWTVWVVAGVVAVVHLAVADRYGAFRNELYFIVCGRHPAFGYVDQPPLVPLIAAATQFAGTHVWALRLPSVVTAVLLVPLTVALAQLFGAGTRAAWLAAVAAACSPLLIAMTAAFSTSTFEPLDFTAIAYLVTRAIVRNEPRAFWWSGAIAGFAFEAKYGVVMWGIGLAAGLVLAGPRTVFRSRDLWIGAGIAAILALPNAAWQLAHGFPFLELVRNDNAGNLTGTPAAFALDQVFSVNFVLAPLWIAGIVAPFVSKRLAGARFLSIAFLVTAILVVTSHGKNYYLAGAYPAMFAVGAAACTALPRLLVALWALLAAANATLALPLVLPVLPPDRLQRMLDRMSFRPPPIERACIGAPLMCMLSDEFGWRELAARTAEVYAALPPADRARAAIFASNYGEAAAIDVYGSGLPPALSGNNQYYLWGPRGYDGSVVIAIDADPAAWKAYCDSARVVASFGDSPYAMPYERNRPIVLCRGMRPGLAQRWPQFKHYGVENLGQ
ncbi:MAG: glycosyltransferase family 39 protein [Candidatus Eremiobacteraeota bacterium]|nr:glycosyltransferase family 39 protein [Candidatus Eremiobacteraeota bacterium]